MIFVHTLGAARIDAGVARYEPRSERKFALLLYLAAERGRRVSRSTLQDFLFPDRTERNGQHSLRQLVYSLREAGIPIESDTNGIELATEAVRSDYSEVIERDRPDTAQLEAAAGGFLPGYAPDHSEAFTEWFEGYRARTVFELCKVILREVQRAKRVADWQTMEKAARGCLGLDPLNEEGTLALAEVLAVSGAKVGAVTLLESYASEVGKRASDLPLNARNLSRRISEEIQHKYLPQSAVPVFGRETELSFLRERFLDKGPGGARCIALIGDAGIGKSRLTGELRSFVSVHGARVVETASQPHDTVRPYSAWIDILPRLIEMPGAAGAEPRSLALIRRLIQAPPEGRRGDDHSEPQVDSPFQASLAIEDLVAAVGDETTLALIFEDAHWLDRASLNVIRHIGAHTRTQHAYMLLTARPNEVIARKLLGLRQATVVHIQRLSAKHARELACHVLAGGRDANTNENIDWILSTAAGNPLFLSILSAHVRDTGDRNVPFTLRNLLEAKIDGVSSESRAILLLSAMLGRHCSLDRLMTAVRMPFVGMVNALTELEQAGLLCATADSSLAQPHPLICDVVVGRTPELARRAAHRCVAELFESDYRAHGSQAFIWDSADHWASAGDLQRAHQAYERCVDHALQLGRPREAAELMCRAAKTADGKERHQLLERATLLACRAGELDVVLRSTRMMRDDGWEPGHDELELAELRVLANCQNIDVTQRLRRCLDDCHSSSHRLEAALVLMMSADAHRKPAAAREAFAAFRRACSESEVNREIQLIGEVVFACGFGDSADCTSLIAELLAIAESLPQHRRPELLRKAGVALMRQGHEDDAFKTWIAGFEFARVSELIQTQFDLAIMIVSHAHDISAHEIEEEWSTTLANLVARFPEFGDSLAFLSWSADLAASKKDLGALRVVQQRVPRSESAFQTARTRRWTTALDYYVQILAREPINVSRAVDELRQWHIEDAETGDCSDFEIAAASCALAQSGQVHSARELIIDYLQRYRHVPSPMWSSLRVVSEDLEVFDEATAVLASKRRAPVGLSTTSA